MCLKTHYLQILISSGCLLVKCTRAFGEHKLTIQKARLNLNSLLWGEGVDESGNKSSIVTVGQVEKDKKRV